MGYFYICSNYDDPEELLKSLKANLRLLRDSPNSTHLIDFIDVDLHCLDKVLHRPNSLRYIKEKDNA